MNIEKYYGYGDIDPFDYDSSFFISPPHICPMCGKLVDDTLGDCICFDCLEDALSDISLEELEDSCS